MLDGAPAAVIATHVLEGAFDGAPYAPVALSRILADAPPDDRHQLEEALRQHVGRSLRSADARLVNTALTHIEVAARAGVPIAIALVAEAHASLGSPEWVSWAARDADAAERLRAEVELVADQAARRIASATCGAG